jgi:F-type H+-transporting ATPase subunit a
MKIDPIHQFNIEPLFTIGHIGKHTIAFTNSSLYMFLSVAVISLLMIGGMARGQLVPGRLQSIAKSPTSSSPARSALPPARKA